MKISIITITYNAAQWLERTMRSVLAQTSKDYEYIIVDGASTDGTVDIIKRLEPQFEGRLSWHSEPDKGLYDAMNKGIRRAVGDYVWFINAGDEIYNLDTLAHMIAAATDETDIIYGKACIVNAEGIKVSEHHKVTPPNLQRKHFLNGLVVCHQAIHGERKHSVLLSLHYTMYPLSGRKSSQKDQNPLGRDCISPPYNLPASVPQPLQSRNKDFCHQEKMSERFRKLLHC